jgi:hypothetical protein
MTSNGLSPKQRPVIPAKAGVQSEGVDAALDSPYAGMTKRAWPVLGAASLISGRSRAVGCENSQFSLPHSTRFWSLLTPFSTKLSTAITFAHSRSMYSRVWYEV